MLSNEEAAKDLNVLCLRDQHIQLLQYENINGSILRDLVRK